MFNRPQLVAEAIESVLGQSYRPIEIIVVDDGSTDETPGVLKEMRASNPEIQILGQANAGPGPARQNGTTFARGEFLQYLDSDDLLRPDKFDMQVSMLRQKTDCGICYGPTVRYQLAGPRSDEHVKWTGRRMDQMFPAFLSDRCWDTSTPLYRAKLVEENGPWLSLLQEEDWEFDCRLAARGVRLAKVAEVVSETRVVPLDRLSHDASRQPRLLADRCAARKAILSHAITACIQRSEPHMQRFLKGSFLVARQAALAGIEGEAESLLDALNSYDRNFVRRAFRNMSRLIGLRRTTIAAESVRSLVRRRSNAPHG